MSLGKELTERPQFSMGGHTENTSRLMRWSLKWAESKGGRNSTLDFDYVRAYEISHKF